MHALDIQPVLQRGIAESGLTRLGTDPVLDGLEHAEYDRDTDAGGEERLVLLGRSEAGRLLAVMFTDRGADAAPLDEARQPTGAAVSSPV